MGDTKGLRKMCECPVCAYGKQVRNLMYRIPDAADKAMIEELYENFICAEDDRDYWKMKYDEIRNPTKEKCP